MPTRLRRRLAAARERGDAGVTLTELLVAMGLSTLLGALTLSLFISIDSSTAAITDRTISASSARNALQAWTGYLRVADGPTAGSRVSRIEWLTANDMLFYADLANRSMSDVGTTSAPTMVWLRRDTAGTLVEETFPASAAASSSPSVCRRLVSRTQAGVPLFSPVDSNGNTMSGLDLGAAPTSAAGCVTLPTTVPSKSRAPDAAALANLQNVYSVQIDFIVRDTRGGHPLEFTSTAVLPALGSV